MDSSGKTQLWLLSLLLACVAVISCRPLGLQSVCEKSESNSSGKDADTGKCTLSKEQVIDAANAAVRLHGWNLEDFDVIYDEENTEWKRFLSDVGTLPPEYEGRDCHIVTYKPRVRPPVTFGGGLEVTVDRNSGAVLGIGEIQ